MAEQAGVVLAGGRSSRMGTPKADLEWHGSTLLRRVCQVVARGVAGPVFVVKAPGQQLPDLDAGVRVLEDAAEGLGPLQGLAVGLAGSAGVAETVFACSTDLPFLHVAFVRAVMGRFARADHAGGHPVDVVLPVVHGFPQPLAAGYHTALFPQAQRLVAERRLRPAFLFDEVRVDRVAGDELLTDPTLAAADPDLDSVLNINAPEDYAAARARPAPEITVERFGVLAAGGGRGPRRVQAATLGQAAQAVGLALDRHVVAAVNGDQIGRDPHQALVAGDTVGFLSADAGG